MNDRITGRARESGYTVIENASLQGRTTFGVPARTDLLIDVHRVGVLPELFGLAALKPGETLVLGGGSNVLFVGDWPGVVVSMATRGIHLLEDRDDAAIVRVDAGENWNDFVHWSLGHGYMGLENLALIPGSVGAAPIQNIGAYGVEVREFIHQVEVFNRHERRFTRLDNAQCEFAYRDSIFKRAPDRFVVSRVDFLLPRTRALCLDYAGVREELARMNVQNPGAAVVAEAISRLRTRKLPNPALTGNAGSFFKNPIVSVDTATQLHSHHPDLPIWEATGNTKKLSAAWMIEACNFKGLREGDAGVSTQHALVLVNHANATGEQIWALAQRIRDTVKARFGVELQPEPSIVRAHT
ncbi:MAG: UDP-N-acetylmuramate dehydrogenase [Rudaea sp.]